ncbi:CBS domain protein with a domain protein [Actinidia rufa]|uniref:CBS domain protein with a domain protein n=1 Tax=Actinidia rufa TaxID=165716 RepID=A0A7J0E9Z3_9ERIC|nr:CBS domain protein with a domain protein [Actinidia rufa]
MAANDVPCCETMFWVYLLISVALVAFAGLMSGLTLGLMSLSLVDLEVLTKAGQPKDRKNAEKILPIVKNQHLLLCTLLICNALAMEALPVFIDALLPAWGAILISVTLILAFGEIIPQSVCSRYGLSIGAKLSVVVRLLVIIVFPLSYPISKLLDLLLGKGHSAILRRAELKTLVNLHGNEAGKGGELTHDETTIISGALDLTQKTAKDAMAPMSEIFSLDLNSKLNEDTMSLIVSKGHSRVPVYSGIPTNIIGLILVKNVIKCRPEDETPIRNLTIRRIPSHMAVVVKSKDAIKETAENGMAKNDILKININSNSSIQNLVEEKDMRRLWLLVTWRLRGPALAEQCNDWHMWPKKCEWKDVTLTNEKSLPDQEEEVVGIITMEDVLEELLQEEILDETDEYVDVHNKIKINMVPSIQSSSRSPRAPSHMMWQTPVASPLSSSHQTPISPYHHSPILRSPIAPYIQSPFTRPTLPESPGKSLPNSPVGFSGLIRCSPSSHRVSRKPYEKLRRPSNS